MTTKAQTSLIIICTLVIGMVLGVLAGGVFRQKRLKQYEQMPLRQQFHHVMERIIQPSEKQRAAIDSTLAKRFEQISTVREKHQQEIFAIYDSLRKDFSALLTQEQRDRVEEHLLKGPRKFIRARVAQWTRDLNLDEKQKQRVQEIVTEGLTSRKPQPNFFGDRRQGRSRKYREMMATIHQKIEAILTPEQRQKFQNIKSHMQMPFGPPIERPRKKRALPEQNGQP